MKNYIMAVLCASFFSGVICLLSPKKNGISKYVSFACSLAAALVLLSPLTGEISAGYTDDFLITADREENARYLSSAAADVLYTAYGIEKEEITAKAEISDSGETEMIELKVSGKRVADKEKTEEYLSELFKVKIKITDRTDDGFDKE